jgi:hypothetical protein
LGRRFCFVIRALSLGLGILLSTILLVVVWQIDRRNAWRSAGKASLWLLAVVAVAGVGAYGYQYYANDLCKALSVDIGPQCFYTEGEVLGAPLSILPVKSTLQKVVNSLGSTSENADERVVVHDQFGYGARIINAHLG